MAKEFAENLRIIGGFSGGFTELVESDFTAPAGAAYVPPERGDYRRINVARTIQILQDGSSKFELYPTAATAYVRLPSNQLGTDETGNDAGDGRVFWFKNSGTKNLELQTSAGVALITLFPGIAVRAIAKQNQSWEVSKADDIYFWYDYLRSVNVNRVIQELADNDTGKGYTETTYTGVFVNTITTYTDATMTKILDKTVFSYSGAFVSQIVKEFYDYETGTIPMVRQTATFVYNPNNSLKNVTIAMTRLV